MEPLVKYTTFRIDRPKLVTIISPHGSQGTKFWDYFPEILSAPEIKENFDLFQQYLQIERDYGANEISHAIANYLVSMNKEYGAGVIEFDYPRGIIDGGRILSHCIRASLPEKLLKKLELKLKKVHHTSLELLKRHYKRLNAKDGVLIDLHTMAPFCPTNSKGKAQTIPISFEGMKSYVEQFTKAPPQNKRMIDLITSDPTGNANADASLSLALKDIFKACDIDFFENHPYVAEQHFLMYQHFINTRAIAIDIPKNKIARADNQQRCFDLINFQLDEQKIHDLAKAIARAVDLAFQSRLAKDTF